MEMLPPKTPIARSVSVKLTLGVGCQVPDLQSEGGAALCEVVGRLHDEERPKNLLRSDGQGDVLPSLRGFGSPERLVEVP